MARASRAILNHEANMEAGSHMVKLVKPEDKRLLGSWRWWNSQPHRSLSALL